MGRVLAASLLLTLSAPPLAAKDDAVLVGVLEHGFLGPTVSTQALSWSWAAAQKKPEVDRPSRSAIGAKRLVALLAG